MDSSRADFQVVVKRIFNNWTALRLAVEHGMGGRNGQKTAIELMNYMYEFCTGNVNITQHEILEVLEELMDQEFNTILEDGSLTEISDHLYRFLKLFKEGKYNEIQTELNRLPPGKEWLSPNVSVTLIRDEEDSTSSEEETDSDCQMDVDAPETGSNKKSSICETSVAEYEPGWTVVRRKGKN